MSKTKSLHGRREGRKREKGWRDSVSAMGDLVFISISDLSAVQSTNQLMLLQMVPSDETEVLTCGRNQPSAVSAF